MTVAVGTINGLIFYANIVITNRQIFFPFRGPNFLTVFISWLNLDLGIETCFYDGMDGYAKTWLQLAFPVYIAFLIVLIIILAHYFQRFARLISGKNPVATLATLLLLSYTKFLRTIVVILLSTNLKCSGDVWLFDANISYGHGKHIYLFILAILIILIGMTFTLILFFSRWIMHCPCHKLLCVNKLKINAFLETYSAPYKMNHHYWTGLLLLARIILYIISARFLDKDVTVFAIIVVVTGLVLWKAIVSRIYKQWPLDVLETSFLINVMVFAGATIAGVGNRDALAYTSVGIAFVTFVLIVTYHTYKYVLLSLSICKRGNDRCELWFTETPIGQTFKRVQLEDSFTGNEYGQGARGTPDPFVSSLQPEISQRHTSVARHLGHERGQNYHTFENQQEQVEDSQHNDNCEENKV